MAVERIAEAGGISSIAHPVRMGYPDPKQMRTMVAEMRDAGLTAIEVYPRATTVPPIPLSIWDWRVNSIWESAGDPISTAT